MTFLPFPGGKQHTNTLINTGLIKMNTRKKMRQGIYGVSRTWLGEGAVQCNIITKQPSNLLWQKAERRSLPPNSFSTGSPMGRQRKQCSWCVQLVDKNKAENGIVRGAVGLSPEKS